MESAEWLAKAAEALVPLTHRKRWPREIGVSVGPMLYVEPHFVGESWRENRYLGRINLSPELLEDEVLATLMHELLHISVGPQRGHNRAFTRAAHRCGFLPPYTESIPDRHLAVALGGVASTLGPYTKLGE
jgi:hypothetical protein